MVTPRDKHFAPKATDPATFAKTVREVLQIPRARSSGFVEALPFSRDDTTSGSETELQAAVEGDRCAVDLPITIQESNYFANIVKRVATGESPGRVVTELEEFLASNCGSVWENSWVRFSADKLSPVAQDVLERDLLADKRQPHAGLRSDAGCFKFTAQGADLVRVPISYLLKLSLAELIASWTRIPISVGTTACKLMDHFLSDNTSPETFSFHVVPLTRETRFGRALAKETAKRYLLSQVLVMYANRKFGLNEFGQKALLYCSPHPPIRQKALNECISDSFYRELFMSPCLSGWDNGEAKKTYMHLCHQVLSRSQLNAVAKLREAGIITRNLVVLPNASNISLANNGTHISLGSLKLTGRRADGECRFTAAHEKYLGDLVIKIVEHFLPLFVGTYSAAPYRIDFSDFHPERVLGFLPHELDYTHLRMIWRRWKNKASLRMFGKPITPFGLMGLDNGLSRLFRIKGDFVRDFRLIDYPVSMMSTNRSPALNGSLGNEERLKKDLSDLGVFDTRMSIYLLYRLREYAKHGFSGFEGRHYSLFESLDDDMGHAVNLQTLLTALAFKYALQGRWTHAHIPDDPGTESERRQIFFCAAIGIPTVFILSDTRNLFLKEIVSRTRHVRFSRRYQGYLRIYCRQYCLALLEMLARDGADLIEALGMQETVDDLRMRLHDPDTHGAAGKLTSQILDKLGESSTLNVKAREFNECAEQYYRTELRQKHIDEAFRLFQEDVWAMESSVGACSSVSREILHAWGMGSEIRGFLSSVQQRLGYEELDVRELEKLGHLLLATIHLDSVRAREKQRSERNHDVNSAPVRGPGDRQDLYGAAFLG